MIALAAMNGVGRDELEGEEANAIVQLDLSAGLGRTRWKKKAEGGWNPCL